MRGTWAGRGVVVRTCSGWAGQGRGRSETAACGEARRPPPPAPPSPQLSPLHHPTRVWTSTLKEEVAPRGRGLSSLVVSGESLPPSVGKSRQVAAGVPPPTRRSPGVGALAQPWGAPLSSWSWVPAAPHLGPSPQVHRRASGISFIRWLETPGLTPFQLNSQRLGKEGRAPSHPAACALWLRSSEVCTPALRPKAGTSQDWVG